MSKAIGAGAVVVGALIVLAVIAGGGLNIITPPPQEEMPITFAIGDDYSSTTPPDTVDIYVYVWENGELKPRDGKLDLTSGDVDTTKSYKTGEVLKIRVTDPTDTSWCTTYFTWTVPSPSASEIESGKFRCDLDILNMDDANNDGTMDWDPAFEENNGTALANGGTVDITNSNYDTNLAYWVLYVYNNDDDTGYINSYNFEDELKNYAYLYLDLSGTGWDRVSIRAGATAQFTRNNHLYAMIPLTQDQLSRDLSPGAGFVGTRNGVCDFSLTFDFSGTQAGDSVTLAYGIRYYSDWENFVDNGSWGYDTASIAESMTVQY